MNFISISERNHIRHIPIKFIWEVYSKEIQSGKVFHTILVIPFWIFLIKNSHKSDSQIVKKEFIDSFFWRCVLFVFIHEKYEYVVSKRYDNSRLVDAFRKPVLINLEFNSYDLPHLNRWDFKGHLCNLQINQKLRKACFQTMSPTF